MAWNMILDSFKHTHISMMTGRDEVSGENKKGVCHSFSPTYMTMVSNQCLWFLDWQGSGFVWDLCVLTFEVLEFHLRETPTKMTGSWQLYTEKL